MGSLRRLQRRLQRLWRRRSKWEFNRASALQEAAIRAHAAQHAMEAPPIIVATVLDMVRIQDPTVVMTGMALLAMARITSAAPTTMTSQHVARPDSDAMHHFLELTIA